MMRFRGRVRVPDTPELKKSILEEGHGVVGAFLSIREIEARALEIRARV